MKHINNMRNVISPIKIIIKDSPLLIKDNIKNILINKLAVKKKPNQSKAIIFL